MFFSFAQTATDLQNKIREKNKAIEKLEDEIASYQRQLENIAEEKNSLNASLRELELVQKKFRADISVTENKIDKANLKIQDLSYDISDKDEMIGHHVEGIAEQLRLIHEFDETPMIEQILSEQDITLVWNDIHNLSVIRDTMDENINLLRQTKSSLVVSKTETEAVRTELSALKQRLRDQKSVVDQNAAEIKKLIADTRNSEANYQTLVNDRLTLKRSFEAELWDFESQLQFILDPNTLPGPGVLSWPLDSVYVTQLFGVTSDSKRLYASGSHSGVDFRAAPSTPVRAMADGVIKSVGNTDITCSGASFGKFVFIQYNNGLSSTYGHLSFIPSRIKTGLAVKRGEIVAYSGNTGHSTAPHLHVSLYASAAVKMQERPITTIVRCLGRAYFMPLAPTNAYLDALYYLPDLPLSAIKNPR